MTDLAADVIPLDTIDRLPPAVLTGATLLCTLLVAAALPDPVTLLTDIDSGDLAAVDPAEVVMAHSLVDGEVRLAAGPAEFRATGAALAAMAERVVVLAGPETLDRAEAQHPGRFSRTRLPA